jgi:hypothetical protein
MEMQQMMELLLKKLRTNNEEILAKLGRRLESLARRDGCRKKSYQSKDESHAR